MKKRFSSQPSLAAAHTMECKLVVILLERAGSHGPVTDLEGDLAATTSGTGRDPTYEGLDVPD